MTKQLDQQGVRSAIEPIIGLTYGKSEWATALVDHLADKIATYDGRNREQMILLACWDWFSGGTTAAKVASQIEAHLSMSTKEGRP